jgi:predicted O-methyltransferase YrrM
MNANDILEMSRGFMEPRLLLTGAELNLFALTAKEPATALALAAKLGVNLRGLSIVLDALAAIGLLEKSEDAYLCPPDVAAALTPDSPTTVLPMVLHSASLWPRWSNLTDIVKNGPPDVEPASFDDEGGMRAFIFAMHVVGSKMAGQFVASVQPGAAKRLIDIGGATGTYAEAFLQACPELRATIFDRAVVIDMARERLAASPVFDRVTLAAGDFYKDELPGGHDLALLSAIIHQNSPEQNIELYGKMFRSLVPGGRAIVRDHVLSPDRTKPRGGAMFAVNMLTATPGGNSYTFEEIRETLEAAGFERVRLIQPDERMNGIVEAFRPV